MTTPAFLPSIISWKWIDQASPEILKSHLNTPKVNLTTLLGYGALSRYTNNRLPAAVDLCEKLIEHLPENKLETFNFIFNQEEKKNLLPHLLTQTIEKRNDAQSKYLFTVQDTFSPEQFHAACARGLYNTAEQMLRRGANPNQSNSDGTSTIMHYAAAHGDERLLDLLLSFDADVNGQDEHGYTPLHWALATNNTSILQKLFEKGADVSIPNQDGESAVAMALKYNKFELREAVACLFKDFPHIYYIILDGDMEAVIESIRSNPKKYLLEGDIGANALEVPVLLHNHELAQFVRDSLNEEKFDKHLKDLQQKYPHTSSIYS